MKVNLSEAYFDLDKFLCGIDTFEMTYGRYPSYVVMNKETYYYIANGYRMFYTVNDNHTSRIFDIPIAYNDGLQFGVVDIV